MKLRIKGNSIRLRLTRSEVEILGKKGYLEERTDFGNCALVYALDVLKNGTELSVDFSDNTLTMHAPGDRVKEWIENETVVSIENNMDVDGLHNLHLLLEKDFKCLGKEGEEDQSDNFNNPSSVC